MALNAFDEMKRFRAYSGAARNFSGTLSTVASDITISVAGWYKFDATQNFYLRGPESATAAATSSDQWWPAGAGPMFYAAVGSHWSMIRDGTSGTYHVGQLSVDV